MPISFTCPHCQTHSEVHDRYAGQAGPCATCGKMIQIPERTAPVGGVGPAASKSTDSTGGLVALALIGIFVFAALIAGVLLFAWFIPTIFYNTPQGHLTSCEDNLKRISAAFEAYRAEHGAYPPAYIADKNGVPMHSWRVLLLEYLDEHELASQYDMNEPWNGPNNMLLARQMPAVYGCPADHALEYNETSYVVATGVGTAFQGDKAMDPSKIRDGMANTLLVVEMADSSINWMQPRDYDGDAEGWRINVSEHGLGSLHKDGGMHALLADGTVVHLSDNVPTDQLRAMATVDGGEKVDPYAWRQ